MTQSPSIIYTWTDEAPALATYAFLKVIRAFVQTAGVDIETRDISLAARVLAQFPDVLGNNAVEDDLAYLLEQQSQLSVGYYDSELANITDELILLEAKETDFKTDETGLKKQAKSVLDNIKNQTLRLKPVDDTLRPIDTLEKEHSKLTTLSDNVKLKLDEYMVEQYDFEKATQEIENKIAIYQTDGVDEKYFELEKLERERDLFQIEVDKLKADVRVKLDKIEKLGNLTHDEDCKHCMSNPFTLDAIQTKENLDKDKLLAQQYLQKKQLMEDEI